MLDKRDIINSLYVLSFPVFGLGSYVSASASPTVGFLVSIFVHLLIILFYAIDLLYKKDFKIRINVFYFLMVLYLMSSVAALFLGASRNALHSSATLTYFKSILLIAPFHAFIAVCLYNDSREEKLVKLTFQSLSLLLLINLVGFYGLGLKNEVHSIEGRINLPFLNDLYSGAGLLAILNLMLLYYMQKTVDDPVKFAALLVYFTVNLVLLFFINSRITNMVFILVFVLFALNILKGYKGLFLVSLFTVPILLNTGILIYRILSLPVFVFIMQRINLVDVTTFNGRSFVWQRAIDWLFYDHRGLVFGNGTNGQYFLHLMPDIAKIWGVQEENTHLHSTVLMVLVDQGLFGYLLLIALFYKMFTHYKKKFQTGSKDGVFFSVVIFMLIAMQVDSFVYPGGLGAVIFGFLMAKGTLTEKILTKDH